MSRTFNMVGGGGGSVATLAVTVTNGTATSVVATKGSDIVSLSYSGGTWNTVLPSYGAWTVTITDGTHANSATVNATQAGAYSVSIYMPDVPSAYTQLEYLQSSGTQYINTGVECTSRLVVDFTAMWFDLTNTAISGGILAGPPHFRHHCTPTAAGALYWCQYNSDNVASVGYSSAASTKYDIHIDPVNGIASCNKTTIGFAKITSNVSTGQGYGLFARIANNGGIQSKASRFYFFECSSGGTILRKMYPARRNSDSVLGMYDAVNDVFYTNAGTGTFTAGPAAA